MNERTLRRLISKVHAEGLRRDRDLRRYGTKPITIRNPESISIRGRLFPVAPRGKDWTFRVKLAGAIIPIEGDEDRSDHEFLQELTDDPDQVAITITAADGSTFQGSSKVRLTAVRVRPRPKPRRRKTKRSKTKKRARRV